MIFTEIWEEMKLERGLSGFLVSLMRVNKYTDGYDVSLGILDFYLVHPIRRGPQWISWSNFSIICFRAHLMIDPTNLHSLHSLIGILVFIVKFYTHLVYVHHSIIQYGYKKFATCVKPLFTYHFDQFDCRSHECSKVLRILIVGYKNLNNYATEQNFN